jgi:hypothetical protein
MKEDLEREMKNLMDLEVARMKIRHHDLMMWAIPRLVIAAIVGGVVAWFNMRFP